MAVQSRKKKPAQNSVSNRKFAVKRRTRDMDLIHEDLKQVDKFKTLPKDEDLPGEGQFYCISCAKHFVDDRVLKEHFRTKNHKRRLKEALQTPHTQDSAYAAVGYGIEKVRKSISK